jgi:hypothetical protein
MPGIGPETVGMPPRPADDSREFVTDVDIVKRDGIIALVIRNQRFRVEGGRLVSVGQSSETAKPINADLAN